MRAYENLPQGDTLLENYPLWDVVNIFPKLLELDLLTLSSSSKVDGWVALFVLNIMANSAQLRWS